MTDQGGLAALRPETRELLKRARRGGGDDPGALLRLREDLQGLTAEELASLWSALGGPQSEDAASESRADAAYRVVDKARRRLLISAERFKDLLFEEIAKSGGGVAPGAASGSLKAMVAAFADEGRAEEIEAAATAIVRSRSLGHDIT